MAVSEEKIHAALSVFDKDADGHLFPNELALSQLSLGVFLPPSDRKHFDEKTENGLGYDAAVSLLKQVSSGRKPLQELEKMFAPFDSKNDGTISALELKAVFDNLADVVSGDTVLRLSAPFTSAGRIKYRDLLQYLLQ